MKKEKNKIQECMLYLLISVGICILLTGCESQQKSGEVLEQKLNAEIQYLSTEVLTMLNETNRISLNNYDVKAKQIGKQEGQGDTKENEETDSASSKQGEQSSSSGEETEDGKGSENTRAKAYELSPNSILINDRTPDWSTLKTKVENLYSDWSTVIADLYKLNINNEDILAFSNDLNNTMVFIKSEKKEDSMMALANLYSYFPKFLSQYSKDNDLVNLYNTKAQVLKAYSYIDQEKWSEIQNSLSKAEEHFMNITNNAAGKPNEYNINKTYIALKEFQNAIGLKDKEVLYVKYKNLIEEMSIL